MLKIVECGIPKATLVAASTVPWSADLERGNPFSHSSQGRLSQQSYTCPISEMCHQCSLWIASWLRWWTRGVILVPLANGGTPSQIRFSHPSKGGTSQQSYTRAISQKCVTRMQKAVRDKSTAVEAGGHNVTGCRYVCMRRGN